MPRSQAQGPSSSGRPARPAQSPQRIDQFVSGEIRPDSDFMFMLPKPFDSTLRKLVGYEYFHKSVGLVDKPAASQLRFAPRGFRRRKQSCIRDGNEFFNTRRIDGECKRSPSAVDKVLEFLGAADAAHEADVLVTPRIGYAEQGLKDVFIQPSNV